jgi:alkanesulfonate monooxygenase SsuD/methylene tetrahydromethanopterin reductase-like flavin-dependent oxidoreductase (luciferase family)
VNDDARLGIGVTLPTWPLRGGGYASWAEMRVLAREAEALGIDTLWVPDHLLRTLPGRPPFGFWECWTILTAAAEATTRIEIGPFIACTGFRNPALLAKMAMTLDEVSGGRLVLGLGSGVPERDESWRAFGYDGERHVAKYAEAVEIVARMLRERAVTFEGEHYRTHAAEIIPRGPRPDGPPVWVAGLGERTARIAARWGDAINVNRALAHPADLDGIRATATAACEAVGRDPSTLRLTGWGRLAIDDNGLAVGKDGWLAGRPDEVAAVLRSFAGGGLAHITLYPGAADDPSPLPALTRASLERFAPFVEALHARSSPETGASCRA